MRKPSVEFVSLQSRRTELWTSWRSSIRPRPCASRRGSRRIRPVRLPRARGVSLLGLSAPSMVTDRPARSSRTSSRGAASSLVLLPPSTFEFDESTNTGLPTPVLVPLMLFRTTSAACSYVEPSAVRMTSLGFLWPAGHCPRTEREPSPAPAPSRSGLRVHGGRRPAPCRPGCLLQGCHRGTANRVSGPPTTLADPHVTRLPDHGPGLPGAGASGRRCATRGPPDPRSVSGVAARRTFGSVAPLEVSALPETSQGTGKCCPVVKER